MTERPTTPRGRAIEPTRTRTPEAERDVHRDADPGVVPTLVAGRPTRSGSPGGRLARAEAAVRGLPEPVRAVGSAVGRAVAVVAGILF